MFEALSERLAAAPQENNGRGVLPPEGRGGRLALLARREGHRPLVAALDLRRPAAVDQLRVLAEREHIAFHTGEGPVESIALSAVAEASRVNSDVVVLDTAGRTHVDGELMAEL